MSKNLSMGSVILSLVVLAAVLYYFRPQTFSFLKQGFGSGDANEEEFDSSEEQEGFDGCPEGKKDDGEGNCVSEGFYTCPDGGEPDDEGNCP